MRKLFLVPPEIGFVGAPDLAAAGRRLASAFLAEGLETAGVAPPAWRPFAFSLDGRESPGEPGAGGVLQGVPALASAICEEARARDLSVRDLPCDLDPGTLGAIRRLFPERIPPLLLLGVARQAPQRAAAFGEAVVEAIRRLGQKTVLLAVGALGLNPDVRQKGVDIQEGVAFDAAVLEALRRRQSGLLLEADPSLWIAARPDAELGHLFFLTGAAPTAEVTTLGYRRTPGAGYALLAFTPLGEATDVPSTEYIR